MNLRLITRCLLPTIALIALAEPTAAAPISLEETIHGVIDGNLLLSAARYDLLAFRDRRAVAEGAYEPVLQAGLTRSGDLPNYIDPELPLSSTSARLGLSQTLPGGGDLSLSYQWTKYSAEAEAQGYTSFPDLRLSLSQPLLRGAWIGPRERALQAALVAEDRGNNDFELIVINLIRDVEDTYWALVEADRQVAAAELSLEGARQQQAWVSERVRLGFDPPSEVLASEERITAAEVDLTAGRANRASAEARLIYLLGRDLKAAGRPRLDPSTDPASIESPPLDQVYTLAFDLNTELRQARLTLLQAKRDHRDAVIDALPAVDGFVSVRRDFGVDGIPPWTAGLNVSTPLPGRGQAHRIAAVKRRFKAAELRLQDVEQRVRLTVEQTLRDIESQDAQVRLKQQTLDVAQRKYEAELERLDRGTATSRDVLRYLEDRDIAVTAYNRSLTAAARAAGRLRQITGTSLRTWSIDLDALLQSLRRLP